MKNSSASEFAHSSYSALVFKSLTASDVEVSLLPFYLGLDFDARRGRFGGGVCDDAIGQHCRALNLDNAIVLACSGRAGLIAAIELHPLVHDWEDTELALAECAEADRTKLSHIFCSLRPSLPESAAALRLSFHLAHPSETFSNCCAEWGVCECRQMDFD
jgi:hypothetical protein